MNEITHKHAVVNTQTENMQKQEAHETIAGPRSRHIARKLINWHHNRHFVFIFYTSRGRRHSLELDASTGRACVGKTSSCTQTCPFFSHMHGLRSRRPPNNHFLFVFLSAPLWKAYVLFAVTDLWVHLQRRVVLLNRKSSTVLLLFGARKDVTLSARGMKYFYDLFIILLLQVEDKNLCFHS